MTIAFRSSMLAVALTAGVAFSASAQDQATWTAVQQLQADLRADRQALVAENLPLSEGEAKAFWPVYKAYAADLSRSGDRKASLIAAYAKNYDTMTDAKADAFMKDYLATEADRVKVRQKYAKAATKVLGAQKAARWMQIETKLDTIVNMGLAGEIPLVPIKK